MKTLLIGLSTLLLVGCGQIENDPNFSKTYCWTWQISSTTTSLNGGTLTDCSFYESGGYRETIQIEKPDTSVISISRSDFSGPEDGTVTGIMIEGSPYYATFVESQKTLILKKQFN